MNEIGRNRRKEIHEDSFLLISPLYSDREEPLKRYERGFLDWKYKDSGREFDHEEDREDFIHYLTIVADKAQEMGLYDPLTSAANRRALYQVFQHRRATIARRGECEEQGVAGVDVTMKVVNDHPDFGGHGGGDKYLQLVADALRKAACRGTDIVTRTGGDEFLAYLPDTDLEGIKTVARRIRDSLIEISDTYFGGISSGGVGAYHFTQDGGVELTDVAGKADKALYAARQKAKRIKRETGVKREPPIAMLSADGKLIEL